MSDTRGNDMHLHACLCEPLHRCNMIHGTALERVLSGIIVSGSDCRCRLSTLFHQSFFKQVSLVTEPLHYQRI